MLFEMTNAIPPSIFASLQKVHVIAVVSRPSFSFLSFPSNLYLANFHTLIPISLSPFSHSRHKTRQNDWYWEDHALLLVSIYSYWSPSFPSYAPSSVPPAGLFPPDPWTLSLSPAFVMKESMASKCIVVVC